jgi:hypothetical protein
VTGLLAVSKKVQFGFAVRLSTNEHNSLFLMPPVPVTQIVDRKVIAHFGPNRHSKERGISMSFQPASICIGVYPE